MNLSSATAPEASTGLFVSVHELPATATAPAMARYELAQVLQTWGLASLADTACLVLSELVTNAVRASTEMDSHARTIVAVRFSWADTSLIIEVWDRNPQAPALQAQFLDAEDGRGLHIVEALSVAAAYYPSPTGQGKVTWCQLEAPAAGAGAAGTTLPHRRPTVARTDPAVRFDDLAVLERVLSGLRKLDARLPRRCP